MQKPEAIIFVVGVVLLTLTFSKTQKAEKRQTNKKSGCQRKQGKMLKMSTEGGEQNKFILT